MAKTESKKTTKKKPGNTKSPKKKAGVKVSKKVPRTKTTKAAADKSKEQKKPQAKGPERYYESVGRRKKAVARVRLYTKKLTDKPHDENRAIIAVNNKPYFQYFGLEYLRDIVEGPLKKLKSVNRFKATAMVAGGGLKGQAEAIRLGIARSLVTFDSNFSKKLRRAGYLTVDSRVKERKKYGLKKARKAPQWSKR